MLLLLTMTIMYRSLEHELLCMNTEALSLLWAGNEDDALALLTRAFALATENAAAHGSNESHRNVIVPLHTNHPNTNNIVPHISSLDMSHVMELASDNRLVQWEGFSFTKQVFLVEGIEEEQDEQEDEDEAMNGQDEVVEGEQQGREEKQPEREKNSDQAVQEEHVSSTTILPTQVMDTLFLSPSMLFNVQKQLQGWTLAQIAALLSYNLAVIHHENGLARGSISSLGRARYYYSQAARIACGDDYSAMESLVFPTLLQGAIVQSKLSRAFLESLWSNLGHVAAFLGDTICVDLCAQHLMRIATASDPRHHHQRRRHPQHSFDSSTSDHATTFAMENVVTGFAASPFSSLVIFSSPQDLFAPAA